MGTISIVIADDHPVVRAGIQGMLASEPDFQVIGEAEKGGEAVELVDRLRPDIVLMDLRMPGLDGVGAIAQLKSQHAETNVLVLTTYDSDAEIVRAVGAGATGYLLKDTPREDLFKAIREAAQGRPVLAPAIVSRLMGQMRAPAPEALSAREIEVLNLVAGGDSNKAIGRHLHISEATVKSNQRPLLDTDLDYLGSARGSAQRIRAR